MPSGTLGLRWLVVLLSISQFATLHRDRRRGELAHIEVVDRRRPTPADQVRISPHADQQRVDLRRLCPRIDRRIDEAHEHPPPILTQRRS